VDAFAHWHRVLAEAGEEKTYFPELRDVTADNGPAVERGSEQESINQLQETFLKI